MVKKSCAYIRLGFCQVITPDMFKTLFDRRFSKTALNLAMFWQWFTNFYGMQLMWWEFATRVGNLILGNIQIFGVLVKQSCETSRGLGFVNQYYYLIILESTGAKALELFRAILSRSGSSKDKFCLSRT